MRTAEEIISSINLNRGNIMYIAETLKINGSLYMDLKKAINEARIETIKECAEKAKTGQGEQWRKDQILSLIDQVK